MVLAESVIISVLKGLSQLVKQDICSAEQDEPRDSGETSTAGFTEEGIKGDSPDRNPELIKNILGQHREESGRRVEVSRKGRNRE